MWSIVNKQVENIKSNYLKKYKDKEIKYKDICKCVNDYFNVKLSNDEINAFALDVLERLNIKD